MNRAWPFPLGVVVVGGLIALGMWLATNWEPPPPFKVVTVRVQAPDDVCWQVEDGPKDPFELNPIYQFRCGSGSVGYDDDYVAVPSSVIVRKTQDNEATLRASFYVNGQPTDSGETDEPGGAVYLSGT